MTAAEFAALVPAVVAVLGALTAWLHAGRAQSAADKATQPNQGTCRLPQSNGSCSDTDRKV